MKGFGNKSYRSYIAVLALSVPLLFCAQTEALSQTATPPAGGASTAGGTYTPNPRAVSLYILGLTAHKQGSMESAIIFFKRACDIDPNLADAQYNLGVLYQMQKRFKEALPRYEEVLRIKPSDPDAHFQMGIILQDTGRPQDARQHFSAIAPNNGHFAEAQRRLAQLNSMPADSVAGTPQTAVQTQPAALQQTSATNPYQDAAIGSQSAATQPQAQASPVQTQATQQAAAQQETPAAQPATAYVPTVSSAPTPSPTGPVPVMANSTLRVIATGFSAPSGLAFDRSGNLYVANYMTNSIDRIGQDGTRNTFCTGVNLRGPIGLVVDDSNNLYVANYNSGTVVKVSPAGISAVIASGFRKPYYLTLDKDGNLYVSQQEDNSIVRIVLPRVVGAKTP